MLQPVFIESAGQQLFSLLFRPSPNTWPRKWIIHVPAFAEEMNKSRVIVSAAARNMTDQGLGVLVPDLSGTGDSQGDLKDASWAQWAAEVQGLVDWLTDNGATSVVLWGLRTGCLLASEVASNAHKSSKYSVNGLVFWQPVINGKQFVNQFLRLRLASEMISQKENRETVSSLLKKLGNEGILEVAGYQLPFDVVEYLYRASLADIKFPDGIALNWLEVSTSLESPIPVVSRKLYENLQEAGVNISYERIKGATFWCTQEITDAPLLRQATTSLFPASSDYHDQAIPALSHSNEGERAITFQCNSHSLAGVFHETKNADKTNNTGVLMIVGGPQYRVGSHRQFVELARYLTNSGYPVFRFDCRGMGDSEGEHPGFENLENDIRTAVDAFSLINPNIKHIVLWGLCDAATAASYYAPTDSRVSSLILLNPWVRSESGQAKAQLKHYYFHRIFQKSLWKKLFSGKLNIMKSLGDIKNTARKAVHSDIEKNSEKSPEKDNNDIEKLSLITKMEQSLSNFKGEILLVLSGNDLTAAEFDDHCGSSRRLKKIVASPQVTTYRLQESDHTFSKRKWKQQVENICSEWLPKIK